MERILGLPITQLTVQMQVALGKDIGNIIKGGKYDYVNKDITADNFEVSRNRELATSAEVILVGFRHYVDSDYVIASFEEHALRPAGLRELLSVDYQNPRVYSGATTVALGSIWYSKNQKRYVPFVYRNTRVRHLDICCWEDGWYSDACFLAIRR